MAKVICTELQKDGASGPNITLDTSKNVTCENNLQVDGNVTVTGTLPADKLTGTAAAINGSNITNLPAANLTGTLPAISGANLTGIVSPLSFRNLIINGAMLVAQRGTSSTTDGYYTVDRWQVNYGGNDEAPTQAQVALPINNAATDLGFRYSLKVTNGNQTGGAGAADYSRIRYKLESQDLASSGWNYKSASSYITLSFWVKSSVSQNFYVQLKTSDADYNYVFETGSLSANTWTKVTHSIPGNSNLVFDNDSNEGIYIAWHLFRGTDNTGSMSLNTWAAENSSLLTPDQTSTWYTTNDATYELTGVQLEVGSTATDFEHRSYGDELDRCQRYYQAWASGSAEMIGPGAMYDDDTVNLFIHLTKEMRATPSCVQTSGTDYYEIQAGGDIGKTNGPFVLLGSNPRSIRMYSDYANSLSSVQGDACIVKTNNAASSIAFNAEL